MIFLKMCIIVEVREVVKVGMTLKRDYTFGLNERKLWELLSFLCCMKK